MTRKEAFEAARDILTEICNREIEGYFARRVFDDSEAEAMRAEIELWRDATLREIEKQMSALVRSMLH
jgi:hypothetical protein